MKFYLYILFSFLPLISLPLLASGTNDNTAVIEWLQNDLKNNYLSSLEEKWGDCGASPESCLSQKEDHVILNLPGKELCFPYTQCGFYNCMEEKFQCESVGVNYFTKLAFPTCSQYVKNVGQEKFSRQGVEWIYNVMVCLQKGLIDECEVRGNCQQTADLRERKKTCEHITEFTLAYHPGCYINSGVGICKLSLKDKHAIWKTVSPFLTDRERQEAYKVIFHCLKPKKLFKKGRVRYQIGLLP